MEKRHEKLWVSMGQLVGMQVSPPAKPDTRTYTLAVQDKWKTGPTIVAVYQGRIEQLREKIKEHKRQVKLARKHGSNVQLAQYRYILRHEGVQLRKWWDAGLNGTQSKAR